MWITNGTQGDELGLGDVFLIYANTGMCVCCELGVGVGLD